MRLSRAALMTATAVGALILAGAPLLFLDQPKDSTPDAALLRAITPPAPAAKPAEAGLRPSTPPDAQPPAAQSAPPATGLDAITRAIPRPAPVIESRPADVASPRVESTTAPMGALAFAPDLARPDGNPLLVPPPAIEVDITGLREAIAAYRIGDIVNGDAWTQRTTNPLARATAEFAAIKLQPKLDRMLAFLAANPDWPAATSVRRRAEEALFADKRPVRQVNEFFAKQKPESALGRLAQARALRDEGRLENARALIRALWRDSDLNQNLEQLILKEFGDALGKADHKFRSDRFALKENNAASYRAAMLAGPDVTALAQARETSNEKQLAALPAEAKTDPTLLFARIQKARRANKILEAGALMLTTPRDPQIIVAPDEWWVERRVLVRKMLDLGDPVSAYKLAAEHSAAGREHRIDAEFLAGWIALRYIGDAALAKKHFEACASHAETPQSISRAAYWRGRAAEALGEKADATIHYQTAASHQTSYYGQLARAKIGRPELELRSPQHVARGDDRNLAVRVVELLHALDQKDLSGPLATEAARNLPNEAQLAALARVMERAGDAGGALNVAKIANQRGFALDEHAFPTYGIPPFEPLVRFAEKPMVYAIARQESAFMPKALSHAGAKGLMQMMTPTAKITAQKAGVPFDENRLIADPAYNAALGSAHLADLLIVYRGSNILTFAAYNAGPRRVREWITAAGDPRDPQVDPIDWIERIPISETRNYVQRIVENLEVYRVRMGETRTIAIEKTLKQADAR